MQSYLKSIRNKKVNWIGFDVMLVSKDLALLSNHYRYYPYHYAPFLSDVRNVSSLTLTFDLGKPFMPFEQLLGVLPSASKDLLPQCYQVPHTLHVPVSQCLLETLPHLLTSSQHLMTSPGSHCWVLPTRLQNGPERQTAGVGSRGAHPVYRRGALNICIHCVSHHNSCDGSAVSWYDCVCIRNAC